MAEYQLIQPIFWSFRNTFCNCFKGYIQGINLAQFYVIDIKWREQDYIQIFADLHACQMLPATNNLALTKLHHLKLEF